MLEAGDRFIDLSFEDNGGGFSDEVLERLFEPYVTTKTRGTGLGLAISIRLAEDLGGGLSVAPNTPKGAVFELRLPAPVRGHFL